MGNEIPFYLNPDIVKLIDQNGHVSINQRPLLEKPKITATNVAKRFLGTTLKVFNHSFIISSLELYYGGIGDQAHDWYRKHFLCKNSKIISQVNVQQLEGITIYIASNSLNSPYRRMDLVIGNEGVPCSLLIRDVISLEASYKRSVAFPNGGPCKVLKQMKIPLAFHGKKLSDFNKNEFLFLDTHHKYVSSKSDIIQRKRFQSQKGFIGFKNLTLGEEEWNFTLKT